MSDTLIQDVETIDLNRTDRKRVVIDNIRVNTTELGYVTAINKNESTFFTQLCKNPNQELINFNANIDEFCRYINGKEKKSKRVPATVSEGDVLCTQYYNEWYRVCVKNSNPAKRTCEVYFVDYGNTEIVDYDYLLCIDPDDLPAIERQPFGIYCTFVAPYELNKEQQDKALDCLMEEYIMIKLSERLSKQHWSVRLPKHAYNTSFWLHFENLPSVKSIALDQATPSESKAAASCS